jgi:heme/copper-type cytochrome/quinol oxidase subunit 2
MTYAESFSISACGTIVTVAFGFVLWMKALICLVVVRLNVSLVRRIPLPDTKAATGVSYEKKTVSPFARVSSVWFGNTVLIVMVLFYSSFYSSSRAVISTS